MINHNAKKGENGLFKGVFMAYSILILHVLLLAGLGCLVLFFRGFVQYMLWIFLGCGGLIIFSGFRIYKKMRQEGKKLKELLSLPMFRGRSVEVSILGGVASLKIGKDENPALPFDSATDQDSYMLEGPDVNKDSATTKIRELTELAKLFENNLITLDEYNRTKNQLLNGTDGP